LTDAGRCTREKDERITAMTQLAMFDVVNSIERKYRPYLVQIPATPSASNDAAAAAAACRLEKFFRSHV
jgi:hypothetical protein